MNITKLIKFVEENSIGTVLLGAFFVCVYICYKISGTSPLDAIVPPAASSPQSASRYSRSEPETLNLDQGIAKIRGMLDDAMSDVRNVSQIMKSIRDDASANTGLIKLNDMSGGYNPGRMGPPEVIRVEVSTSDEKRYEDALANLGKTAHDKGFELGKQIAGEMERIVASNINEALKANVQSSCAMALASLETQVQFDTWIQRYYPAGETLTIDVVGELTDEDRRILAAYIKTFHAKGNSAVEKQGGEVTIRVAPVLHANNFASKIKLGSVSNISGQKFTWNINGSDLGTFGEQERARMAAAKQKEIEEEKAQAASEAAEEAREFDDGIDRVRFLLAKIIGPTTFHDTAGDLERAIDRLKDAIEDQSNPNAFSNHEGYAEIEQELQRLAAEPSLRVMISSIMGACDMESLLAYDTFREYPDPAEDRNHPDYLLANLNILVGGGHFEREEAVDRLSSIKIEQPRAL